MNNRNNLLRRLFALAMEYIQFLQQRKSTKDADFFKALCELFPEGMRPQIRVEVGNVLYLQPGFKKTANSISHTLAPTQYYASGKVELHFSARTKISSDIILLTQDIFFFYDYFIPTVASITRGVSFFKLINEVRPMVILDSKMDIISFNHNFEREVYPKESGIKNFMHWILPTRRDEVTIAFNRALAGEINCILHPHPHRKDETNELIFSPLVSHEPERGVIVIIALNRPLIDIQLKYGLTATEIRIANFIQSGKQSKEIAETLGNSVDTIKWHCKQIRSKLGLTGSRTPLRVQLQAYPPFIPHS